MNIVVPELGESVVEARIARWLKKEGDPVAMGEALVELETEKIDLEVSADRAGVLTAIRHPEGADVKVGEVLAVLDPAGAAAAAATPPAPDAPAAAAAPSGAAPAASGGPAPKATPAAKNVAREHAVSLADVPASGARVTKQDVREFVAAGATPAAVAPPAPPAAAGRLPPPRRPARALKSGCA
ncbi:MAG: biotin/lipoyl-containing protein [Vicinamibacterales bacterium]